MISEAEARARLLGNIEPLPAERLAAAQAVDRFAAAPVLSPAALPRFDQSAMDGYALRAADAPGPLKIVGEQPAGADRGLEIGEGEALRIFTGAPLPRGADAVVMQEDVEKGEAGILLSAAVAPGEFIRRRGEDVCEGQQLLASGDLLTAPRIGLLCAAGVTEISVHRRPRVVILTTGNELRAPGTALAAGELYESNGAMLAAQLSADGTIIGSAHLPDDPSALAAAIRSFSGADALVISAGVSVGDHDPVHAALRELGAKTDFWRVAVKPGKPFLFARLGPQRIFGLPGNPVSTFVTAHLFVRPSLAKLAGSGTPHPIHVPVPTAADVRNPDPARVLYLRAAWRDGQAHPAPLQQSHGLASLAASDLLIRLEPNAIHARGTTVDALPLKFR